jgi:hypothetical protein
MRTAWLSAIGLGAIVTDLTGQARPAMDLVTHSRVRIERPAASIWPLIIEPSSWKRGLELVHHEGPRGARGEVFAARDPGSRATIAFFVENVELETNRRRTIKLYAPTGTLIGFATWTLTGVDGGTEVGYDVFSETVVSQEQARAMGRDSLRLMERQAFTTNQQRFDDELLALKRLVESRP